MEDDTHLGTKSGRVAVVTGAASGLGRAFAHRLAADGWSVAIMDVNARGAAEVAAELRHQGALAHAYAVDLADAVEVEQMVGVAANELGPITLLIANAGVGGPSDLDAPESQWQHEWQVDVMGVVRVCRAVLPGMLQRGAGELLLVASGAGLLTNPEALSYTAAKHAVVGIATWLAARYGASGIKVSCFCPSGIATDLLENGVSDSFRRMLGPIAVAPEVAAEQALAGLERGTLLTSTLGAVLDEFAEFAADPDTWVAGAQRVVARLGAIPPHGG